MELYNMWSSVTGVFHLIYIYIYIYFNFRLSRRKEGLFIYLIYGCVGSSFLCEGFL